MTQVVYQVTIEEEGMPASRQIGLASDMALIINIITIGIIIADINYVHAIVNKGTRAINRGAPPGNMAATVNSGTSLNTECVKIMHIDTIVKKAVARYIAPDVIVIGDTIACYLSAIIDVLTLRAYAAEMIQ